jgi:hypothetical protein
MFVCDVSTDGKTRGKIPPQGQIRPDCNRKSFAETIVETRRMRDKFTGGLAFRPFRQPG